MFHFIIFVLIGLACFSSGGITISSTFLEFASETGYRFTIFSVILFPVNCSVRVHSKPGNQGIIREFENGPFFTKKSGNYQGILIEYQGIHGELTLS